MHDIKDIRRDTEAFTAAMAARGMSACEVEALLEADRNRREAETAAQNLQTLRNEIARKVGAAKRTGGDTAELLAEGERTGTAAAQANECIARLKDMASVFPNTLHAATPPGTHEAENVVLKTVGEARTMPWARPHWEFAGALGLDAEAGADLAGSRFTVLHGAMARLERALGQWMLDLHTSEHGYEETAVPHLVRPEILRGTGQLPKFAEDLFPAGPEHYLIPTAEVPLTNLVRGQHVDPAMLPLRMTALTPCYRAEAGSAGRDTRGYLRQHQFTKAELVSVALPEDADAEHERMTRCAETVLERLGLAYRRVALCAGDLGFSATRTFDLEVWLPGQGAWREISSCSTCGDFQARRMGTRLRGRRDLPHTLNGSGVATGRALVAVLENNLQEDGTVRVPVVLRPYMGGLEILRARQGGRQP